MRRRGRVGLLAILVASALLVLGGAQAAYQELRVYFAGDEAADRFDALAADTYEAGPSPSSIRMVLDNCQRSISGVYGLMRSADERRPVLEACLRHADAAAARNASFSYAWYVGALSAARLGDVVGFNIRLLQSHITAPYEHWLAMLRASLVEGHFGSTAAHLLPRHTSDLRLLVGSQTGILWVARRYVEDPGFRERIADVVEGMTETDQARFVASLRSLAGQAGP